MLQRQIQHYIRFQEWFGPFDHQENQIMLLVILRAIQSFKDYHRNLRELSALTDRELADIGIDRSDIPRVAAGHAID